MSRKIIAALTDSTVFLREWLSNPQGMGAVAPSSPLLGAAMARWLPCNKDGYVLELGPGTGAVTASLLKHGLNEERLVAIEKNPTLAGRLSKRYSRATIIVGDAWEMDNLLRSRLNGLESVIAVFSSLPLLNFPKCQADLLAAKIRSVLKPGGRWVQYSYQIGKGSCRGSEEFELVASKIVWLNIPPARVHVFQK